MKNYDSSPSNDDVEQSNRPLLGSINESPTAIKPVEAKSPNDSDLNEVSVLIKDPSSPVLQPVKDKFYIVYGIFLLFGIAILLPWNIFITASDYFDFKLNTNTSADSEYRKGFTFYVGIVGQITNVIMNLVNILITFGGNPKNRIPYTIMLCAAVIIFQIALAIVNSYDWPLTFFVLCCVSVFVMYVATGIMQSCVYYVASIFPMEYINAIVLGNNLSGIFTTIMSIVSKLSSPNPRIAAIFYFLSAFLILMIAFMGYFLMHRMKFYRYYSELAEKRNREMQSLNNDQQVKVPYLMLIKKTWILLFCIWFNFFSTLAIFPVYQLGVKRVSESFIIPDKWFQDVVTFLTFNVLVTIGNLIPKLIRKPGPRLLPIPVILRGVLVFLFFAFANFSPDKRNFIPVLIKNDYVYWAGCAISPLLFGYFTSLLMMYTPNQVEAQHSGSVAMIAAFLITVGVTTGLNFSKVFGMIVVS